MVEEEPQGEEPLLYPDLVPEAFTLKQSDGLRRWALWVTVDAAPHWNNLSALMVVLGCCAMFAYDPCTKRGSFLELVDILVTVFFSIELAMRVLALGLHGEDGTFLRDHYNKLDLVILVADLASIILKVKVDLSLYSDILRPLRVVRRIPHMRVFVAMLFEILNMFLIIVGVCFLVFAVFGTIAVQLWSGELNRRCFLDEDAAYKYNRSMPPYYGKNRMLPFLCSHPSRHGMQTCEDIPVYIDNGTFCTLHPDDLFNQSSNYTGECVDWNELYNTCGNSEDNPFQNSVNFDNIGNALISIFQAVTLEGWTAIMYMVMDAYSFWSFLFFVILTIIGAFVMLNVCAVVITSQFSETMDQHQHDNDQGFLETMSGKIISWVTRFLSDHPWCRAVAASWERLYSLPAVQRFLSWWTPLRAKIKKVVDSKLFDQVMLLFAVASTAVIAAEHHGQPEGMDDGIWICGIAFAVLFLLEMLLKLAAHSWGYFKDFHRVVESVTVVVSIGEVSSRTRYSALFKFARCVLCSKLLRKLLLVLWKTLQKAVWLCALLLLSIYWYSVLGMHIFGCQASFKSTLKDPIHARRHFDNLLWAMITVFQILTLSDWNHVMYTGMEATNTWASLFFITVIVLCKHLLLNVLVSIVVQTFHEQMAPDDDENPEVANPDGIVLDPENPVAARSPWAADPVSDNPDGIVPCPDDSAEPSRRPEAAAATQEEPGYKAAALRYVKSVGKKYAPSWWKKRKHWSLFLLSPNNRLRLLLQKITSHQSFDISILVFILASCISVAVENPNIAKGTVERFVLDVLDYLFSAIFMLEMMFKVLANGLVFGKAAYLRNPWNALDGSLVLISAINITVALASSGKNGLLVLKVLRLLRILRPLRVLKRTRRLKLALEAVIVSLKPLLNVFLLSCVFFIFYGLLGVQLFQGKFYNCQDRYMKDYRKVTTKAECLALNYTWTRRQLNFDNLAQALMALFVMYSQDGWTNIMYDGIDAVAVDVQPVVNHNQVMILYFLSFMVMSFFLLDMFISTMVESYHQAQKKQQQTGEDPLDPPDEAPVDDSFHLQYSSWRCKVYRISLHRFTDYFMTLVIFLSVVVMMFEYYNMPEGLKELMEYSFYVFTAILVGEILMKLVANGLKRFFKNKWNILDLVVVLVSLISILFSQLKVTYEIPIKPSILRVLRALRLAHVLKTKMLRLLMMTVVKTLLQVWNLIWLFVFFFYIYAILSVELFGQIKCTPLHPCVGIHRHSNFENFGQALMSLYRICTGDNWNGILRDMLRQCRPDDHGCVGYLSWVAPLVIITFVVMAQFMLVNLVVASIMQALEDSLERKAHEALELLSTSTPPNSQPDSPESSLPPEYPPDFSPCSTPGDTPPEYPPGYTPCSTPGDTPPEFPPEYSPCSSPGVTPPDFPPGYSPCSTPGVTPPEFPPDFPPDIDDSPNTVHEALPPEYPPDFSPCSSPGVTPPDFPPGYTPYSSPGVTPPEFPPDIDYSL